jgi:hypothetical protein
MNGHPAEAALHGLAEGTLEGAERAVVERHVAGCLPCRREVDGLRALLAAAAALPREIEPPSDLWAGIEERMGQGEAGRGKGTSADRQTARPPVRRFRLAAAAVLALLVIGTTLVLLRDVPGPQIADEPRPLSPARARPQWGGVEAEYSRAASEVTLESERDALAPDALAVVDAGLRVVDQAIAESRAALALDPGSVELAHLVAAAYERKIDLLRWAGRLAASD